MARVYCYASRTLPLNDAGIATFGAELVAVTDAFRAHTTRAASLCPTGHDFAPHITLLYHGHAPTPEFCAALAPHVHTSVVYPAIALGVQKLEAPNARALVLAFECEALQDLHASIRADVIAATRQTPMMTPHAGVHKHSFQPHMTLALFDSAEALEFAWATIDPDALRGPVFIGNLQVLAA
jgi:2'-5' RNA ligase